MLKTVCQTHRFASDFPTHHEVFLQFMPPGHNFQIPVNLTCRAFHKLWSQTEVDTKLRFRQDCIIAGVFIIHGSL